FPGGGILPPGGATFALLSPPTSAGFVPLSERVPTDATPPIEADGAPETYYRPCVLPATLMFTEGMPPDAAVSWVITTDLCQPIYFERDDGLIVFGTPGSTFSPEGERTLLLREGAVLAIAGKNGLVVRSASGVVNVPPGSPVAVEQISSRELKLNSLYGCDVKITVGDGTAEQTLSAGPGDDIIISDTPEPQSAEASGESGGSLVPVPVKPTVVRQGPGRNTLLEKLMLCNLNCFPEKLKKRIRTLLEKAQELQETGKLPPISSADPSKQTQQPRALISINLLPAAYQPVAGKGTTKISGDLQTVDTGAATIKATVLGARVNIKQPGHLQLAEGQLLIATREKTTIDAGAYTIELEPDTLVLVSKDERVVTLGALWSKRLNSVRARMKDKYVSILEGQEVMFGPSSDLVMREVKSDRVARRNIRGFDLPEGHHIAFSEFSFVSLIQNTDLLNKIAKSTNADDKHLAEKIIKMAAAVAYVTRTRGAYAVLTMNR
ncbi:MAG TPA: hypothetical protein V6D08_14295, partial [Candidatus Obscuribacterales bacterium]